MFTVCMFFFQSHLLGVFDNVNEAEFHPKEYDKILAVISQEGEKLPVSNVGSRLYFHLCCLSVDVFSLICFKKKRSSPKLMHFAPSHHW